MHSISPDKYAEFITATKRMAGRPIRIGQLFCNIMRLQRSPSLVPIENTLWQLDGEDAMTYIRQNFAVE